MWDFEGRSLKYLMCSKCIFQPDCKALFLVFANVANVVLYGWAEVSVEWGLPRQAASPQLRKCLRAKAVALWAFWVGNGKTVTRCVVYASCRQPCFPGWGDSWNAEELLQAAGEAGLCNETFFSHRSNTVTELGRWGWGAFKSLWPRQEWLALVSAASSHPPFLSKCITDKISYYRCLSSSRCPLCCLPLKSERIVSLW